MKRVYKLKKGVKEVLLKVILTVLIALADILLYSCLKMLGIYAGQGSIIDAFLMVGWFWLSLGGVFAMNLIWEN